MIKSKGCSRARNIINPHTAALPWILQPNQVSLLATNRFKTSYGDWPGKSRGVGGRNLKQLNGLKRFNINANKTINSKKILEERQTWIKKRTISKANYTKYNKPTTPYLKLFAQQSKDKQNLSIVKAPVVISKENTRQKLLYEYRAREYENTKSRDEHKYIQIHKNNTSSNDNVKISKNEIEATEKNIVNSEKDNKAMEISKDDKQSETSNMKDTHKGCIHNYKFGDKIGKGAYAIVKEAIHISTNTSVAIKIYDRLKFSEPRRKKRLEQEIRILKLLEHRNIVKFFDYFRCTNYLYVVMELVKGQSLREYIKSMPNKKLNEENAIKILKEITIALHYCHTNNIFHRDIKLDNILIDEEGKVKIIDFGFSVMDNNKLKIHCGTLSYMSPELIAKKDHLGGPADMWALGIVFYAMLFGRYPFTGKADAELIAKIKEANIKVSDEVSTNTQFIIKRFFEIDPEKRLTVQELLNCL